MKLTDLAIDGYGVCRDLRLGRFNDGLNLVYGETGSGKTTIRNFVRGVLYGFDSPSPQAVSNQLNLAGGQLDVQHNNCDYRLVRDIKISGNLNLQPLTSAGQCVQGIDQLNGNLNLSLYDSVFSVGFHDVRRNYRGLATTLHTRLGVPLGSNAVRDEAAFAQWQTESQALANERVNIQRRIDSLTTEKRGYQDQIDQANSLRSQQLSAIERRITEVNAQINSLDRASTQNRINSLQSEIQRVQQLIKNTEVKRVPAPQPIDEPIFSDADVHATLYQRLDEIEIQVRRWRQIQSEIQSQRVRLRDEMLKWNELTPESDQHPYHDAREILISLESKVDEAEKHAKAWSSGAEMDFDETIDLLKDLCKNMRDDIFGLGDELRSQYKKIRQKSAAAQLKQLRQYYKEMGDNNERLLNQRAAVVKQIRCCDPVGAEAIERADQQYCSCAQKEGNLQARRRFVGPLPKSQKAHAEPTITVVQPDLTNERNRLNELKLQLSNEQAALARYDQQSNNLRAQHAEYLIQRDTLVSPLHHRDITAKIENIDFELRRLTDQYNEISVRLDTRMFGDSAPNPLLDQAAKYLTRISRGDLLQVWLDDHLGEIFAKDQFNNNIRFESLSRGQQDLVYLSLCLAAREALAQQGVMSPMLLDDVFANLDSQRVSAVYDVIYEQCVQGRQTVVFAKNNELVRPAISSNVTIFELPPTIVPAPYSSPDRQPYNPMRDLNWESTFNTDIEFYKSFQEPSVYVGSDKGNSYPISKYPRSGVRIDLTPATFERETDQDFIREFDSYPERQVVAVHHPQQPATRYQTVKTFTESSRLGNDGIVGLSQLGHLDRFGIKTLENLLELNPEQLPFEFSNAGISSSDIDRWQAQYWLLICTPGMTIFDAQILYACGISEPEQLDTTNSQQLLERIQRYLTTADGQRFAGRSYSNDYINQWYRALDAKRENWSRGAGNRSGGYSRRSRRRRESRPNLRTYDASERKRAPRPEYVQDRPERASKPARSRLTRTNRSSRTPVTTTPMVKSFTERQRAVRTTPSQSRPDPIQPTKKKKSPGDRKLRFYLDLNDHVEAAPSIGNRTAERFEKIGVTTIRELLRNTAESMATKINYKRISANSIRDWQNQARLVCRIPNLRGHDAQLLVACDITEPEDLAVMQPQKLMNIIGPFSDTKEGLKIIRSGKKPDLDEIKDWIEWAGHTRALQAA